MVGPLLGEGGEIGLQHVADDGVGAAAGVEGGDHRRQVARVVLGQGLDEGGGLPVVLRPDAGLVHQPLERQHSPGVHPVKVHAAIAGLGEETQLHGGGEALGQPVAVVAEPALLEQPDVGELVAEDGLPLGEALGVAVVRRAEVAVRTVW